jgi:hypothetical protein
MGSLLRQTCAAAAALATAAAFAQAPTVAPQLAKACAELPAGAQDARSLALRSQCVLGGAIASERRFAEGRELARKSLELGDPAGGFMLYMVFRSDPANGYLRGGKVDMDAYRRLGARPLAERGEQIEALDGLAFAAVKGHVVGAITLASHFAETVAPHNVERVLGLTSLYLRNGETDPALQRLALQARQVLQFGPTKASIRSFIDASYSAGGAAGYAYVQRNDGKTCERFTPKVLESGEVQGAEYLPLKHKSLANTFLLRGTWAETWNLSGCGQDIPVTVTFVADGWGGASFTAEAAKTK